jgi:pimeloyl-ACP methyl ester carboxylesterase
VNEQFAQVGDDIELCYETFGDPSDPAVLLVMGLGTQMIGWHEDFCTEVASRGLFAIRFDNRDSGRSTHFRGIRPPTLVQMIRRDPGAAAYRLPDMAADAIGLLDVLGIERAHVVGASMGGMVAQTIAARHPDRVLSLTSIMSTTGKRFVGEPAFSLLPIFLRRAPRERDAYVERTVELFGRIGSPGFEGDIERLRDMAGLSFDRAQDGAGTGRQLAAILASGDRTNELRSIRVPTLVIHGTADKLVRPNGGKATARAIPGAKLMKIEGMGHDLPRQAWPRIIDAIVENAQRSTISSTTTTVSTNSTAPDTAAAG